MNQVGFHEYTNVLFKKSNTIKLTYIVYVRMLEMYFCTFKSILPLRVESHILKEKRNIWEVILCLSHAEQETGQ